MKTVLASLPDPTAAPARRRRGGSARRWFVPVAVVLSILTHLTVVGLLLLPHRPPIAFEPESQGGVELMMVQQDGGAPNPEAKPAQPSKPAATSQPSLAPLPPLAVAGGDEPAPPPPPNPGTAEPRPQQVQAQAAPPADQAPAPSGLAAPPAPKAPKPVPKMEFSVEGAESDTGFIALGNGDLPASPDERCHNPVPISDLAIHGAQGDVLVTVHVAANGVAAGAEVMSSSGWASLDRAAVSALRRWCYHPAMKGGEPVPGDLTINVEFKRD